MLRKLTYYTKIFFILLFVIVKTLRQQMYPVYPKIYDLLNVFWYLEELLMACVCYIIKFLKAGHK